MKKKLLAILLAAGILLTLCPAALAAEVPADRLDTIGSIWDAAHMSIKDIRTVSGLSRTAFAEHLCIPYRTVQDWELGTRACPGYLRLLIAEHFGVFRRPEADR